MPETCEYVSLCGKRNFADMIKTRNSRLGDYSGLLGGAQLNHKYSYKGDSGGSESEKEM